MSIEKPSSTRALSGPISKTAWSLPESVDNPEKINVIVWIKLIPMSNLKGRDGSKNSREKGKNGFSANIQNQIYSSNLINCSKENIVNSLMVSWTWTLHPLTWPLQKMHFAALKNRNEFSESTMHVKWNKKKRGWFCTPWFNSKCTRIFYSKQPECNL